MIPSHKRGSCPALDQPMQTGDGLLIRLAPQTGFFTAMELQQVALAADECGNGVIEISSRGNVQIRGLTAQSLSLFQKRIEAARIDLRTGIAIMMNPLAGFDPTRVKDAGVLYQLVSKQAARKDLRSSLGPKVSLIIDDGGRFGVSHLLGDIRAKATRRGTQSVWRLSVGGTKGASRLIGFASNDKDAVAAIIGLLEQIAVAGRSTRARDLDLCHLLAGVPRNCLSELDDVELPLPDSPATELRAVGTNGDADNHVDGNGGGDAEPPLLIGPFSLGLGCQVVGLGLAFGHSDARAVSKLTAAVQRIDGDKLYPAYGKTILIPVKNDTVAASLRQEAAALGFITRPDDPRLLFLICAGAPACQSATIDTKSLARKLMNDYNDQTGFLASQPASQLTGQPASQPGTALSLPGRIHISGCAKRCASSRPQLLEIIGSRDGSRLYHNGTLQDCSNDDHLRTTVQKILRLSDSEASPCLGNRTRATNRN